MKNFSKTFVISAGLSVTMLACADPVAAQKPCPAGIVDLPAAIDAIHGIGPIDHHQWQNVNVDGMRIRTGWKDIETQDGVYNWQLIDDCLALAVTSGKFLGLSVVAGVSSPPWLMGADTLTDGSTTINGSTLTSPTANFVAADVGRVIVCVDIFPLGTTIISTTSSTVATLSAPASANKTGGLIFSILARHPGVPFRVLTPPDAGALPVPWDSTVLTKWLEFIAAFGARYNGDPRLLYVPMGGLGQTGESRLVTVQADIDYFNASAVAAGYTATVDLSAGMVAWEAVAKETTDAYMTAFPTTPPFITAAAPFPDTEGGDTGLDDFMTWGVATYPGRFGIMNAQLNAIAQPSFTAWAPIYNNWHSQPTGTQFLCSTGNTDNVARLSNAPPWGSSPLLSAYDAINNSFTAAVNIGCKFVETYEVDVKNSTYQTMLATEGAALKLNASATPTPTPSPPSITTQPANQTVTEGQTANFNVVATSTAPLDYQWTKNGANIAGATSASYTTPPTTLADNGSIFAVVVSNGGGSVTSNNATLTLNTPPLITTQPADRTVTVGQTAYFSVVATGTTRLYYQWMKNSANISGATSPSYITPATTTADNGALFAVVVSNVAGIVTSNNATLTVNSAVRPSITTQPANKTVAAGKTAKFTVTAAGTAPLTYQWTKNGVNISGATKASYITPATTTADNGALFAVVVSNVAGSVTSNNATLTVK